MHVTYFKIKKEANATIRQLESVAHNFKSRQQI